MSRWYCPCGARPRSEICSKCGGAKPAPRKLVPTPEPEPAPVVLDAYEELRAKGYQIIGPYYPSEWEIAVPPDGYVGDGMSLTEYREHLARENSPPGLAKRAFEEKLRFMKKLYRDDPQGFVAAMAKTKRQSESERLEHLLAHGQWFSGAVCEKCRTGE